MISTHAYNLQMIKWQNVYRDTHTRIESIERREASKKIKPENIFNFVSVGNSAELKFNNGTLYKQRHSTRLPL
jgi:hypothetical protein